MAYQTEIELTVKLKFTLVGDQKALSQNQFEKFSRLPKRRIHITSYNIDSITPKKIDYKGQDSYSHTVLYRKIITKSIDINYRFYLGKKIGDIMSFEICPAGFRTNVIALIITQGNKFTIYYDNPPAMIIFQLTNPNVHIIDSNKYRPITLDVADPNFENDLTKALSGHVLRGQ